MSVITTGNFPKLLWPGLNKMWGLNYADPDKYYTDLFDTESSEQQYEEDQELTGFGYVPQKPQGTAISYDTHSQGNTTRYTHVPYGMGFIITHEEMMDNLYLKRGMARTKALARSFKITKETVAGNVYNRAQTSGYTGGDGVVLLSTAHACLNGSQANKATTDADFSEAALEDMMILISKAVDSRGLKIGLKAKSLHGPVDQQFEFARVLKSVGQSGTANNDINALRASGLLPGGFKTNPFLTDADSWFVRTDAPEGMKLIQREEAAFAQDGDFDTSNLKYKGYERYSVGWTDWRAVYGSMGA